MKRTIRAGGALLAVLLTATACSTPPAGKDDAATDPIVIGFAIAETGFVNAYDLPPLNVAKMAVADINEAGGVEGRSLEILVEDTASDPANAGTAATALIEAGADIIVTSCDFDQGAPAAIAAQDAGIIAFSTCAASTGFGPSGIGPLAFTMATAAPVEGAAMAEWAFGEKSWKTAFVLHDDSSTFSAETTHGFANRFEEVGGSVVGTESFMQDDASIATQIERIRAADPEVIWFTSYGPGAISALRQIRAAGIDTPIVSDENFDGDYWKEGVQDVSDLYFATYGSIYGDDPDSVVNDIVERYVDEFGTEPDTSLMLTGFALVEALALAIEKTGGSTDGEELGAALETFKDEDLLLVTTFTAKDHIAYQRTLRIMQIQSGKTSFVTEFSPESTPAL